MSINNSENEVWATLSVTKLRQKYRNNGVGLCSYTRIDALTQSRLAMRRGKLSVLPLSASQPDTSAAHVLVRDCFFLINLFKRRHRS